MQDNGLRVRLLSDSAKCDDGLLEAADDQQDWSLFLKGLTSDFSLGEHFQPLCNLLSFWNLERKAEPCLTMQLESTIEVLAKHMLKYSRIS